MIQQLRGWPVPIGVSDTSRVAVRVRTLPAGVETTAQVLTVRLGTVLALLPKEVAVGEAEVQK